MSARRTPLLTLLLALSGCATAGVPTSTARVERQPESTAELLSRTMPGVVLLVAERPDGRLAYGAALLLDGEGHLLTSLHVVEGARRLRGLLHDPQRQTFTPMEGGLARLLFERQGELHDARLLLGDPLSDLAVVALEADTSGLPVLPFAPTQPAPGETVYALGHPQEMAWSATRGVVSALHEGAIQHDALLAPGSSGGPLVDARGAVVGIAVARAEEAGSAALRGLAFARPIGLARWVLQQGLRADPGPAPGVLALDLTSPARAAESCARALAWGEPAATRCLDWGEAPARRSPLEAERSLLADLHATRPELCELQPGGRPVASLPRTVPLGLALHRQGVKVEAVEPRGAQQAWVLLAGRTAQGEPFRHAALLRRHRGEWRWRLTPDEAERSTLPVGWPPPWPAM